jgi:hypothetical protein
VTNGLWYAFTVGSVQVISLANDDVTYQDGGNSYVRGCSEGAQKAWLEQELTAARGDHDVDWIIVCMHEVAISASCADTSTITSARTRSVPANRTPP